MRRGRGTVPVVEPGEEKARLGGALSAPAGRFSRVRSHVLRSAAW